MTRKHLAVLIGGSRDGERMWLPYAFSQLHLRSAQDEQECYSRKMSWGTGTHHLYVFVELLNVEDK